MTCSSVIPKLIQKKIDTLLPLLPPIRKNSRPAKGPQRRRNDSDRRPEFCTIIAMSTHVRDCQTCIQHNWTMNKGNRTVDTEKERKIHTRVKFRSIQWQINE